ncbi:MAG: cbb3-type cytochrome c oxidase subunit I [Candidatus Bipolaricaulota bacterium]|nr:cbb3-type cytochrome c oxidase subunit I [Candidatus Bipolaricaulota bacterium]MCS7275354.1 cbb3-type cytochrome c oxidase subunit I [Candidatus Bipolaricaulota bacterium]MDW8110147.1 cbb3-type cytochrome c oxidase subunit I [Candidatus Bipolaricaulota bacterium]MDW8329652.1 cbb3-type cytochrome c oxidase subunit I [Candidatus Bipolaricaulota bacterium]
MQEREKQAVKLWFFSSLVWLALGPLIGALMSLQFLWPDALNFLADLNLSYSKARIFHTNLVIYGWIAMSFVAAILFIIPKLCDVELQHARVAYWAGWLWNLSVALDLALIWAGIVGDPLLSIQPYEYAEAPLLVDLLIVIAAVMIIFSVHRTVLARKRPHLYVSVWYLLGGLYTTAITYLVGNFLTLAFTGLGNQIIHAWWLHNAVGMFITPLGIGIAYYLIPIAAQQPIYSHRLSILGFWTLMAFYPGTGLHHFLQMPMPTWIGEFSVISSVLLIIPVLAVVVNHLATPAQNWRRVFDSFPLRFSVFGTVYYLLTCIQGTFQTTHAVNWFVHFTEWVQAHAHLALTGAFTCYGMAALIYIFPRVTGRQLYSRTLVSWVFWIMAVVFPLFYLAFTHSGLVTGVSVNLLNHTIYETISAVWLARFFRTLMGAGVVLGFLLFGYLIVRSLRVGPRFEEGTNEVAEPAPAPATRRVTV